MSTLRVSNIEAKADASSPTIDEKVKVTNSQGRVLIQIDGKTAGITSIGINTTSTSFTIDGNQNVQFVGVITVTNLNATGIVTATSFSGPLTGNATGLSGNPSISVSTIGVNGASPQTPIDAISNSSGNGITVRGRSADGLGNIRFTSNNYATLYGGFKHDASTLTIFNELSGSLKLGTNGIDRVTIDSSGNLQLSTANTSILNSSGRKILNQTGGILQVVSVNKTDQYYQSGTGTPTDVPGLSVSITPSSTSSRILILGHVNFSATSAGGDSFARLMRNSTEIGSGADGYFGQVAGQDYFAVHSRVIYLIDSPATTSSTTYKIQVWGQELYVNSRGLNGNFDTSSQIVLMEIAG